MRLACTGQPEHLINYMNQSYHDMFKSAAEKLCILELNKEIHSLCKAGEISSFQSKYAGNFKDLYRTQHLQLDQKAHLFLRLINTVAVNPKSVRRNKLKTADSLIPSIMNAIGVLLNCRNQSMNTNALLNTLILRRGKADKACVQRLQKLGICLSYTSLLKKQLDLTRNY